MKKEEFLIKLRATLLDRGVSEETVEKEAEAVRVYLNESNMDEVDISIDVMADGIVSVLDDHPHEQIELPAVASSEADSESVSDEFSAAIAQINGDITPDDSVSQVNDENNDEEPIPVFLVSEASDEEPTDQEIAPEILFVLENGSEGAEPASETAVCKEKELASGDYEESPSSIVADDPTEALANVFSEEPEEKLKVYPEHKEDPIAVTDQVNDIDEDTAEIEEFIPLDKKRRMKNKQITNKHSENEWLYIALLVVTIPIAIALVLIAFVLYLGFWVALALAMIACIAVLIVFVTLGAVVSLIGIVYGAVQLITGLTPVGLFEIGLGVVVGSAVLFVGILVYNFAVRFIPFCMKLLAKLFRAGFRALRSGYHSLKGAVESI